MIPLLIACGRQDVLWIQMGPVVVNLDLAPGRKQACYDIDKTKLSGATKSGGTDE